MNPSQYQLNVLWAKWQALYDEAAPLVCTQEFWEDAVSYFHGCAICGAIDAEEHLLFIPPIHGGKMFVHNVIPACSRCAKLIRGRQDKNPFYAYFMHRDINVQKVLEAMLYLEDKVHEIDRFNWDEDELEITFICSEATSVLPFNGIWARRKFEAEWPPDIRVQTKQDLFYDQEEGWGISWRLVDEPLNKR